MADKTGLLVGKKAVSSFLDDASDYMLEKFLKMGMPVVIDGKGKNWLAHKDNIEEFFRHQTCKKVENVSEAMSVEK